MEKRTVRNLTELAEFAHELHGELLKREGEQATVVALHGDLGAGKTALVQQLAQAFGITKQVTSPTFIIMQSFPLVSGQNSTAHYNKLVHIDTYRIEDLEEVKVLGFEALFKEKHSIMFIEWAEKINDILPASTIHVTFTISPNEDREIYINGI